MRKVNVKVDEQMAAATTTAAGENNDDEAMPVTLFPRSQGFSSRSSIALPAASTDMHRSHDTK
jgi:hypothetical protein